MDKFLIRTKRSPRPERKSTETKDNKKQSTIESLAVRKQISLAVFVVYLEVDRVSSVAIYFCYIPIHSQFGYRHVFLVSF